MLKKRLHILREHPRLLTISSDVPLLLGLSALLETSHSATCDLFIESLVTKYSNRIFQSILNCSRSQWRNFRAAVTCWDNLVSLRKQTAKSSINWVPSIVYVGTGHWCRSLSLALCVFGCLNPHSKHTWIKLNLCTYLPPAQKLSILLHACYLKERAMMVMLTQLVPRGNIANRNSVRN